MIEVELAIYGTADWHAHRAKVLAKIEEVSVENKNMDESFVLCMEGSPWSSCQLDQNRHSC